MFNSGNIHYAGRPPLAKHEPPKQYNNIEDNMEDLNLASAQLMRKHTLKKLSRYEVYAKRAVDNNEDPTRFYEKINRLFEKFSLYHSRVTEMTLNNRVDLPQNTNTLSFNKTPAINQNETTSFRFNNGTRPSFSHSLDNAPNSIAENTNAHEPVLFKEFERVTKAILAGNPRVTLRIFSETFNQHASNQIDFFRMPEKELRQLFEEMPGVILQKNALNKSYNILDLNIVCFPFRSQRICECGLDCDGRNGELALGWRTMQCAAELAGECDLKANCNFLHTKTMYT